MALDLSLTIDEVDIAIRSLVADERLNALFSIRVEAVVTSAIAPGAAFSLALEGDATITGIVTAVETVPLGDETLSTIDLGPKVFPLTLGRDSIVYQNKSVVDVVKDILTASGIAASETEWSLQGAASPLPSFVRRDESDWSFISRILDEAGIHYYFRHSNDGTKLWFEDDSASQPSQKIRYRTEHGSQAKDTYVAGLTTRAVITTDGALVRDRDPAKPALALEGKDGGTNNVFYEWPGRFQTPSDGTARAKSIRERLSATNILRHGRSGDASIACGITFEITEHPTPARNEKLHCIARRIRADVRSIDFAWTAIPAATLFRAGFRDPLRSPRGPEPVVITGPAGAEISVDDSARVTFQTLWDRRGKKDDKASPATRTAQAPLAESMAIPRVGFSMLLAHHDGDLERPFVLARHTDGVAPPPQKLPDNKTQSLWRTLTSASDGTSSEIRFEDKSDSEELFVHAAKDMTVTIGDNEAWTIGNDDTLEITGNRTTDVGADEKLTVAGDQSTTITGKETVTFDQNRSLTVKGSETTEVDGSRSTSADDDTVRDVAKAISLSVGGKATTQSKKAFTREIVGKSTEQSGQAFTRASDAGMKITIAADASDTIGAKRSDSGKKGISTLVGGDLTEKIAASSTISANGGFGEAAKGKLTLKSGAAITTMGQTIEVLGASSITITCGSSSIAIKDGEVDIKSAAITATGAMTVLNGATVKHNP